MSYKLPHIVLVGLAPLLGIVLIISGCNSQPEIAQSPLLAEVGNSRLTLNEALLHIPISVLSQDSSGSIERYRAQWVREQLVADEARRQGVHETEAFKTALRSFERQLLIQLMADYYLSENAEAEVSREQALRFYEQHRDQMVLSERHVLLNHMISATMDDATNARQDLFRGVDWETIVMNYAVDPNYSLRTATIFQPVSKALEDIPAMAQFISRIGVSEVSPIRNVDGQYHFVQLVENQDEGTVPELDWALEQIRDWIAIEQKRTQINAFQQNLIRQAEANRSIRLHD